MQNFSETEVDRYYICRADFSHGNVLVDFFNTAAAQNWFQVTFKDGEIISANHDNPQATKRRGVAASKQDAVAVPNNSFTHFRYVILRGSEVSLRWNPEIEVGDRDLTFTVDHGSLKKQMGQCNQKSEASLTLYKLVANESEKFVFAIGDGQDTEGSNDLPVQLTVPVNLPYNLDPGSDIFFDLSVSKASTPLIKMFDKNSEILLDLYQGPEGNGIYFHTPDYSKKKPFGYTDNDCEVVARYVLSHKLLTSIFKSSLTKTTMAHFVWYPDLPLKIWMYLSNWGEMSILIYPTS
jgi:hypothetical protein